MLINKQEAFFTLCLMQVLDKTFSIVAPMPSTEESAVSTAPPPEQENYLWMGSNTRHQSCPDPSYHLTPSATFAL